jgi:hypothetical protein
VGAIGRRSKRRGAFAPRGDDHASFGVLSPPPIPDEILVRICHVAEMYQGFDDLVALRL